MRELRVIGDSIFLDGVVVAKIVVPAGTLRYRMERIVTGDDIEDILENFRSEIMTEIDMIRAAVNDRVDRAADQMKKETLEAVRLMIDRGVGRT